MRNGRKSANESTSTNGNFAVNEIELGPQLGLTVTTSRGTSDRAPMPSKKLHAPKQPARRGVGGWGVRPAAPIMRTRRVDKQRGLDSRLSWEPEPALGRRPGPLTTD